MAASERRELICEITFALQLPEINENVGIQLSNKSWRSTQLNGREKTTPVDMLFHLNTSA
jgi:hypothetical protein